MTAAPDPVWEFLEALPEPIRRELHHTAELVSNVHTAISVHGWTPQQLAREAARDQRGAANAAAIVIHRLRRAAGRPPPDSGHAGPPTRPFCTETCRVNAGWILDDEGRPARRCACRTRKDR